MPDERLNHAERQKTAVELTAGSGYLGLAAGSGYTENATGSECVEIARGLSGPNSVVGPGIAWERGSVGGV